MRWILPSIAARPPSPVETDGDRWHSDPKRIPEDNRRDNDLEVAGYKLLRFNTTQVCEQMAEYCLPTIQKIIRNAGGLLDGEDKGTPRFTGKSLCQKSDERAPSCSFQKIRREWPRAYHKWTEEDERQLVGLYGERASLQKIAIALERPTFGNTFADQENGIKEIGRILAERPRRAVFCTAGFLIKVWVEGVWGKAPFPKGGSPRNSAPDQVHTSMNFLNERSNVASASAGKQHAGSCLLAR